MPQQLPRYRRFEERERDLERISKLIGDGEDVNLHGRLLTSSADGHDPARLRGLPAIGRNVAGHIRGSDPLGEVLRREARQRR